MRHTALAVLAAATLALTGCSNSDDGKPTKPTPTVTVTPSAPAKLSLADQMAACTDAIAAGKDKGDGAPECADLSPDDYLKALQAANRRARASFDACTDDPSACTDDQ